MSVVHVDRFPDHILSSGLELLDGLFASLPTNSGTAFMTSYLSSPPLVTPQHASGDRVVALGLRFARGVGLVMGGVGVNVPSSALPKGGPGVPGGASTPIVDLPGRWLDPDNGVLAPGYLHPDSGVPTSVGGVGPHKGVSQFKHGGSRGSLRHGSFSVRHGGYWCPRGGIRFACGKYQSSARSG